MCLLNDCKWLFKINNLYYILIKTSFTEKDSLFFKYFWDNLKSIINYMITLSKYLQVE